MNTPRFSRAILAGALSVLGFSGSALAAGPAVSEAIHEDQVKQQQLQGDASALAEQLDAMIAEYGRNGLGGEDVETVKAMRDAITKMSKTEMAQVVALLDKARAATDPGQAKKVVSDAFSAQKGILVQMKKLLAEHLRNQQALELSTELSDLADRQATNLQNGIELGKWAGGKKPADFEAALRAHLEGQKTEESAIAEELKILQGKLAEFAKNAESAELALRFQRGVDEVQKLLPAADAASDALKEGQVFKAVTGEKTLRDEMRKLAHEVAPPQNSTEALREAERQLSKLENEQKDVAATAVKDQQPDFDAWLAQKAAENAGNNGDKQFKRPMEALRTDKHLHEMFDNQKRDKAGELAGLEETQGDLANKADLAAQDLSQNAPAAAQALKAAQEKMQEARAAMSDENAAGAAKMAADAAAAIEAARAQVAQIAQSGNKTADQEMKDLKALAQAAQDLGRKEAAASVNPDKSGQAALAQQAQQLAQQGAAMDPKGAAALEKAAADAQKAADAAAAGQAQQAAAAQLAAAQDLGQAAQQLAQQMQQVARAQAILNAGQKLQLKIAPIIKAEQALERDTAKSTALYKPKKEELFKGQSERQEAIQTDTGSLKESISPDFTSVLSALTDAQIDMGSAKTELEKPAGQPADDAENKALDDLYRAQQILEQKIEVAQNDANQEPQPPQADPGAAQQAEDDVNRAMTEMQQGQLQQAAQQLAQAAAEAGQLAAMPGAPQEAQQAAQQLSQAAAQAAAQNAEQAQAAAQQGQQELAQAQAAMAAQEAGLHQTGNEPAHQGPPHPGQHQGHTPSQGTHAAQNYQSSGEQGLEKGVRTASAKPANFSSLPARERAAIEQAQSEKYPEEYGTLVEQYMRNLAAESSGAK